MADLWVRGARLLAPMEESDCLVREGRIAALGRVLPSAVPHGCPVLDAAGRYLAPGFIDMHVHGGGGAEFMDAEPEAIRTIAAFHAAHGTTTLCAAIIPAPVDRMRRAMAAVAEAAEPGIAGLYLEGPFVSPAKKGAFNTRWLRPPSAGALRKLVEGYQDLVKVVTFAPERPGADQLLADILAIGAVPAVGHTAATYEQTMDAVAHGVCHFTHFGNAMSGLHHREPGVVGTALSSSHTTLEVIADGVHIHPAVIRLLVEFLAARGQLDRMCLITDAISATGMPDGIYQLGDQEIIARAGEVRLRDGTLAGSVLTMERAVQNTAAFAGLSPAEAVRLATANPARTLGLASRKGELTLGADGDLVLLDDDLAVWATVRAGEVVFSRDGGR